MKSYINNLRKNPLFYYILVTVLIALWPLILRALCLPAAQKKWELEKNQYSQAQELIKQILDIDPERMEFAAAKTQDAGFDYAETIDKVAGMCKISPANYSLTSGIITTSGGQKSQSARLSLKDVDITKFAKFLSTIQFRWANLQCSQVKLTKKKGLPDTWNVDLDFKYYY